MKFKFILLTLLTAMLANCASLSTMQTARVHKPGKSQHALGFGFYNSDDFIGGDAISIPVLEYAYRRGVWDDIDLGIKLTNLGAMVGDLKYNLVDGKNWAVATGLGIGYLDFESSSNGVTATSTIIDIIVPIYLSYDFSKMTSLYSAGKYIQRAISTSDSGITTEDGGMMSASLGFKYGDSAGVLLEGSFVSGLDNDFTGSQFNFGYFFSFN